MRDIKTFVDIDKIIEDISHINEPKGKYLGMGWQSARNSVIDYLNRLKNE